LSAAALAWSTAYLWNLVADLTSRLGTLIIALRQVAVPSRFVAVQPGIFCRLLVQVHREDLGYRNGDEEYFEHALD
jgi:hypothetical protein